MVQEWEHYTRGIIIDRHRERFGVEPNREAFALFRRYFVGGSLLEVGPGAGYFLAAAKEGGFRVSGIEINPQERAYISETWGIETQAEPLEAGAFPPASVDNVVSFNCLEHIQDPDAHIKAIARVLRPGGRLVLTTHNVGGLAAKLSGSWWPMYRVPDHVALATRASLKRIGARNGLTLIRCWTGEFPLETPATVAAGYRDWWKERRSGPSDRGRIDKPFDSSPAMAKARGIMRHPAFSPVGGLMSLLGIANSIRIVFEAP